MNVALLHPEEHHLPLSRRQVVALGATGIAAAAFGWPGLHAEPAPHLLADIMAACPDLTTWQSLVRAAGLERRFRGVEPLTALVPDDDVFERHPAALAAIRRLDAADLAHFVLAHVLDGRYPLDLLMGVGTVATLAGSEMEFDVVADANLTVSWDDGIFTAATTITQLPLQAQNGLVYPLRGFVIAGA